MKEQTRAVMSCLENDVALTFAQDRAIARPPRKMHAARTETGGQRAEDYEKREAQTEEEPSRTSIVDDATFSNLKTTAEGAQQAALTDLARSTKSYHCSRHQYGGMMSIPQKSQTTSRLSVSLR